MNARVILLVIGYGSDPIKQIAESRAREWRDLRGPRVTIYKSNFIYIYYYCTFVRRHLLRFRAQRLRCSIILLDESYHSVVQLKSIQPNI